MTDVRSSYYWNYKSLDKLMEDLHENMEQDDIYSGDIISFSVNSAFVRNYDIEGENYTGLVYHAVLLYSADE